MPIHRSSHQEGRLVRKLIPRCSFFFWITKVIQKEATNRRKYIQLELLQSTVWFAARWLAVYRLGIATAAGSAAWQHQDGMGSASDFSRIFEGTVGIVTSFLQF